MSLSSAELSTIQQAGSALHRASQTISEALRTRAQKLVDQVSSHPANADSEQAFSQFRQISSLCQELARMEERLKALYALVSARQKGGLTARGKQIQLTKKSRTPARTDKRVAQHGQLHPKPLSANDVKVLNYFKGILKTDEWTPLTGAVVAVGAGLPKGSVGVSILRVVASGAVRRGPGGTYQLAAP